MYTPQVSLRKTQAIDEFRYHGNPCAKNPEHGTVRYIRNHSCVACQKERNKANRKTEVGKAKKREIQQRIRDNNKIGRQIAERIETLTRMKAIDLAVVKYQDPMRWRECWADAVAEMTP